MKCLKPALSLLCIVFSLSICAQNRDVSTGLPYSNKIEVSDPALESLFHASDNVSLELAPGFRIQGKIQSRTKHGESITSLLIQLDNHPGGVLSICRYQDPNGKIYYTGHLLKLHEPDGMMLVAKDQHYFFIETQQRFLVGE